jgi:hypothetical protein
MKNIYKKIALVFSALALIVSCDEDEFTGDSTVEVTNPSLSVELGFANSQTLVEQAATYDFTVTLSEIQIADVRVFLTQTSGTATAGEDFEFPSTITIPRGATSASGAINILADDIVEDTETVVITIGTGLEANVSATNSQTVTFNIMNLEDGDLAVGMSWATSIVTEDDGTEVGATDFADLRLVVSSTPDNSGDIDVADGGSFESLTLPASTPDGDYYVVADFYAASDIVRDIDITVTFDQVGVINGQTHEFPAALTSSNTCDLAYNVLAKITKTGDSYAFEEVGSYSLDFENLTFVTWSGIDATDAFACVGGCPSQITSSEDCINPFLRGINANWMFGSWGEEIQEEANVYYTDDGTGNLTIPTQYIFTTLYDGDLYDYTITGTGVIDGTGTLTLQYYLDQDGFGVSEWMFANGFMTTDYFEAIVSAD